jgi:hypothetical protein
VNQSEPQKRILVNRIVTMSSIRQDSSNDNAEFTTAPVDQDVSGMGAFAKNPSGFAKTVIAPANALPAAHAAQQARDAADEAFRSAQNAQQFAAAAANTFALNAASFTKGGGAAAASSSMTPEERRARLRDQLHLAYVTEGDEEKDESSHHEGDDDDGRSAAKKMRVEQQPREVIHRHIKHPPVIQEFQLSHEHTFLIENEPHMRNLYMFIRKLADLEPPNPTHRVPSLQHREERMGLMWNTNRSSIEFKHSLRIIADFKNELHQAGGDRAQKAFVIQQFGDKLNGNMCYFINSAVVTAMRNVMVQLRQNNDIDIAKIALVDLLAVQALTDCFAPMVNARMLMPAAPTTLRNVSDKSHAILMDTYQYYLDKLTNARCVKTRAGDQWEL